MGRGRLPHDEEEFYGNTVGRASMIERLARLLGSLIGLHVSDDDARQQGQEWADDIRGAARRQQDDTLGWMGKRRNERRRGKRR